MAKKQSTVERLIGQWYEMPELMGYSGEVRVLEWASKEELRVKFESNLGLHQIAKDTGYDFDVQDAVTTATKIALDWEEDEPLHATLKATAANTNYEGKFTRGTMTAERYMGENDDELLVVHWDDEWNECGVAIVHLSRKWQ